VFGSQMVGLFPRPKYDGVLGMWYGKAPGWTGRATPSSTRTTRAWARTGRAGPRGRRSRVKSSTLPSHSEVALYDALMPTIFPGNVQEILDLGLHGFMLSRVSGSGWG